MKWYLEKIQLPFENESGVNGNLSVMEHPHGGIICNIPIQNKNRIEIKSYYFDEEPKSWIQQGKAIQYRNSFKDFSQVTFLNLMGNLQMMYCVNHKFLQNFSTDYGKNWRFKSETIEVDVDWEVRNPPLFVQMGRILLPAFDKLAGRSFAYISDDTGKNWFPSVFIEPVDEEDVDNFTISLLKSPTFVLAGERKIISYLQSESEKYIFQSISEDFGETWQPPESTGIPSSSCNISSIRLQDGKGIFTPYIVIAFTEKEETDNDCESEIKIAISSDIGVSWEVQSVDKCMKPIQGISLIQTRDESIHILYATKNTAYHLKLEDIEIEGNY